MTKIYKTVRKQIGEAEFSHECEDGTFIVGRLEDDHDCANPCTDCDGAGHIRSLSNRHINSIYADEARELLENDPMVVALSYFEHGLCLWDVQGGNRFGACPDRQWDGVSFAGVWIPDDCCREEITARLANSAAGPEAIQEVARTLAAECCDQYTKWSNGECFGYIVSKIDADGNEIEQLDSCWGFIGREYATEELKSAFEGYAGKAGAQ